jgi:hypothetical protein
MTQARSFANPFDMVDLTESLNIIPNTWGLIGELGIFANEGVTQHTINLEVAEGTLSLIGDKVRGDRNTQSNQDNRTIQAFSIPHFPMDDFLSPEDLVGKRAYGRDAQDTESEAIARKLLRIRKNHAATIEAARAYALTNGAVYSPNGTVVGNYYTSFGVTQKSIDFVLGTPTTDIVAKTEEGIAHSMDNSLGGDTATGMVGLASPEFFAKLIAQATVVSAYRSFQAVTDSTKRWGGETSMNRKFHYAGVDWIEYRGAYNGTRLIPAGEAYMVPMGTSETFKSYYSPANKLSLVGTVGMESYAFQYRDPKDEGILLQSEHNAIHLVRRPQTVIKCTTSN